MQIDGSSETDADQAIKELQTNHGITSLDVVIANAGIAKVFPKVQDAQTEDLLEHFSTNVVANIILFRAVLPLLKSSSATKSEERAKFVVMGSNAGTIGDQEKVNIPNAVYGTSKAALNYVAMKIHLENEDLVAFPVHPG